MSEPEAETSSETVVQGPYVYENWQRIIRGDASGTTFEYPLFSDAQIVGERLDGLGPYKLLNGRAMSPRTGYRPAVVLRAEVATYTRPLRYDWTTDTTRYHGGYFQDEVAALVSLSLGVRIKAGHLTREFNEGGDPMGTPMALEQVDLSLLRAADSSQPMLPYTIDKPHRQNGIDIRDVYALAAMPLLTPEEATALVVSARTYQNALLVAEADPALSWLLLVSAVETAANHWKASESSPVERLKSAKRKLYRLLMDAGGEPLASQAAEMIAHTLRATDKFTRFIKEFLPGPRAQRPEAWMQVDWSPENLESVIVKIYDYRSEALHTGRPFPLPMCEPPFPVAAPGSPYPSEKPQGLASSAMGGTWNGEDTPMLLHVFEYIVRYSLLSWCRSMVTSHGPTAPGKLERTEE